MKAPTYNLKITGSGSVEELLGSLIEIVNGIESCLSSSDREFLDIREGKTSWEDSTLFTEITRQE